MCVYVYMHYMYRLFVSCLYTLWRLVLLLFAVTIHCYSLLAAALTC